MSAAFVPTNSATSDSILTTAQFKPLKLSFPPSSSANPERFNQTTTEFPRIDLMAASIKITGSNFLQRSSPLPSSRFFMSRCNRNSLFVNPARSQRKCGLRKTVMSPMAAAVTTEKLLGVVVEGREEKAAAKCIVRASVTVRRNVKEGIKERMANQLDAFVDKFGRNVVLELVSTEINPKTGLPKTSKSAVVKGWSEKKHVKSERMVYTADFIVSSSFGDPGAITVVNRHIKEFYLETIVVEGFASGPIHFPCNSWVQSTKNHPDKRVFFTNKPYLPYETPSGLRELRERELKELRGDGKGERKLFDRVYDYATYNDLGNPDKGFEYARPILGGNKKLPYPRRCRTGRPLSETDMRMESRVENPNPIYVPRDEAFEEAKCDMLTAGAQKALLHNIVPSLVTSMTPESKEFGGFHEVDNLFKIGLQLKESMQDQFLKKLPLVTKIHESSEGLFKYDTPDIISKDKFAWLRDDEFARQTLAGINPVNIERLQVFPPTSKLDPSVYGSPESAVTEEHILVHLNGMSVQQALDEKKLYMLDYHDVYLPFVDKINAQPGRKTYATRTIFFLSPLGTLKPIAIELSLPPTAAGSSKAKRVLTPPNDATNNWIWQLAKAHVCSNDAGVHQLVNHWLRTHACVEPFIIAAHRQLSAMHPIFKLLKPHMRYTLEINALARQILINSGGVIESGFTPGPCGMEMSSAFYREHWRFDQESLPADLIRRGIAEPDASQPHGIKLLIADYPYANDGLLLWSSIQKWVTTYVETYYPNPNSIKADTELQAWYSEAVNVGHADKRDAAWWPRLSTPSDLTSILTTLIWLSSAQHASLNFGQYPLGGYVPSRPPLMRRLVPAEGDPEYEHFLADPHGFYLSAMPSLLQATMFMTVIDTLSTHSSDEEYIGERPETYRWTADSEMVEAFHEFAAEIKKAEEEIERRNQDPGFRNRCGAGVLPYELMMPSSQPGITCRGVPNSVSI